MTLCFNRENLTYWELNENDQDGLPGWRLSATAKKCYTEPDDAPVSGSGLGAVR